MTQTPIATKSLSYAIYLSDYEIQKAQSTLNTLKKVKNLNNSISNLKEPFDSLTNYINNSQGDNNINANIFSLSDRLEPDVKQYISPFNDSITLLNEPMTQKQNAFDMYIKLQNDKLNSINKQLQLLELKTNNANRFNKPNNIKSIKNSSTSLSLNVDEYNAYGLSTTNYGITQNQYNYNNSTQDNKNCVPIDNSNSNYYLIYGNNGCLSYNPDELINDKPYDFIKCNANDPRQQFYINPVNDLCAYNNLIVNNIDQINDKSIINLGFNAITPSSDINQCLTADSNSITIQPCTLDNNQKFKSFTKSIIY